MRILVIENDTDITSYIAKRLKNDVIRGKPEKAAKVLRTANTGPQHRLVDIPLAVTLGKTEPALKSLPARDSQALADARRRLIHDSIINAANENPAG